VAGTKWCYLWCRRSQGYTFSGCHLVSINWFISVQGATASSQQDYWKRVVDMFSGLHVLFKSLKVVNEATHRHLPPAVCWLPTEERRGQRASGGAALSTGQRRERHRQNVNRQRSPKKKKTTWWASVFNCEVNSGQHHRELISRDT